MAALPMAFGCILGSLFMDHFGRKQAHIFSTIPTTIGWLLIYFARNINMILAGRFLTGIVVGFLAPVTGVYIGETASPSYRGLLLAAISCAIAVGLLFSHLIGTWMDWQTTALISTVIPLIGLLIMFFTPESPVFYARKGHIDKAKNSFIWCRGDDEETTREMEVMLERIGKTDKIDNFWSTHIYVSEFWRPLLVIVGFIVANQWCGVNAITFYTVSIIQQTIGNDFNEYLGMLIIDIIRVIVSIIACILLRRFGRRPLAIISGIGTFISLFLLSGITFASKLLPQTPFIPLFLIVNYIIFVSIGFIPLPWAMIGEVFPSTTRNIGSGVSSLMAFLAFFSVVKTSPFMFTNYGAYGTFFIYGIVALVGTIFVYFLLPETKGKRLHEIEDEFKKQADNC